MLRAAQMPDFVCLSIPLSIGLQDFHEIGLRGKRVVGVQLI